MTKTAEQADVLLPATSWGEHGGVFTCADRGFQRFEKAIEPTYNVKRDWEIISLLAQRDGLPDALRRQPANLGRNARAVPAVLRRHL
ncbi:Formate dehydrogenase H [Kluyvera cryocrescens]|uniref:Formate dehydrogenase H n=1 Tax=Kluyvera cryocrescens TaxID=580 RepID=A0A485AUC1_KLUCR|nr:Formate dehydrogenase H [Kluyvera cryocrescens]